MDGWNTTFLLGRPIFRGYVSFREGSHLSLLESQQFFDILKYYTATLYNHQTKKKTHTSQPQKVFGNHEVIELLAKKSVL